MLLVIAKIGFIYFEGISYYLIWNMSLASL